ncbi:hypothetical protein DCAR_0728916 [Daucus carota subsp. sativus]|uniref:Glycosyl transferase CAP10 domain-containing protein n=1 Tax=Daucus carota subsp. sativus TaxID=79200 RepID=A0A164TX37_DAUCS|nr:PREDICTED: O-glucosyltransferase rumi homolog [Daucus carota subsp. sativus]WOH09459.1 hypothetical protein DCAR_0728916 [Daucus carota subsp. sativus]
MKKFYEEKYKNTFWLRQNFTQKRWRSFRKQATTTALLLLFFFLFIAVLVFAGYINITVHTGHSAEKPIISISRMAETPLLPPLDCLAWNETQKCPQSNPVLLKYMLNHDPSMNMACPEYFRWIHEDLRHWRETGISKDMVDRANRTAHFRLVIIDGKAYVEKYVKSIQTRDLYTIWGIVQLLRWYPGRLPDLDMMFDCNDRPVIRSKDHRGPNAAPPPLFRYCSDVWSMDIVFPDWSFWGWVETNIKPWANVVKDIKEGNKRTKWKDREPFAYWKGNPSVAATRADLMRCNVTDKTDWNARLFIQDWNKESKVGYKQSNLEDQCTYRYKIYIEGWAWSVSEKYILACDSPTLLVTQRFYDFFTRGMVPLQHYWPIRDRDKCRSLKFAVEWGNNNTEKAQAIGKASSRFIQEELKQEYVYDYMFHLLNEYAKLLKYKPSIPPNAIELCPETMACLAGGDYNKFMMASLVNSPRDSVPCTMPPPYDAQALKAFIDTQIGSTRKVEAWENEYWEKLNKKQ